MRSNATEMPVSGRFSAGLRRLAGGLLDAALPPHCLTCDLPVSENGTLCGACYRGLSFIVAPFCQGCGLPLPFAGASRCETCLTHPHRFAAARAALLYDAGARGLILPFKHGDRTELARPLAAQMARAGAALLARAELLVPVPLHWKKLFSRRYNQAALLGEILARHAKKPWAPDALRRVRATATLGELGAVQRSLAVAGAFAVAPRHAPRVVGRRILLIDDVLTSGATADACTEVLLAAGAVAVDVLAAARVPDPRLRA